MFRVSCKAIAISMLLAVPAWAGPATLVQLQGNVWITPPDGRETTAARGIELAPGTRIRTGPNSEAQLQFENGSVLKVRPNTSMSLSGNKRVSNKNSIVLFFGRLWSKVTKSDQNHYEIKTANAVCGVRGTEFETAVADDGSVRVRVDEGRVAVADDDDEKPVDAGHEITGDEGGTAGTAPAARDPKWSTWENDKRKRVDTGGRALVDSMKGKIMSRKAKLEALRARQKELEGQRKALESRARRGDSQALEEIRRINQSLAEIADAIADIGDQAESQFGVVDHYADLARQFKFVDHKYLVSQAESLRRIKADFDRMVKDGTDISMEAMDKLLDDMGSGRGGGLKDDSGSSAKDLFGDDDMLK